MARFLTRIVWLAAVGVLAPAACGGDDAPPARPPFGVMRGVPIYPGAVVVARSTSAEALEARLRVRAEPESVAVWYRRTLGERGWILVGDARTADGAITLHGQRDGPPVWVVIRRATDGGTELSLIGAVSDTTR